METVVEQVSVPVLVDRRQSAASTASTDSDDGPAPLAASPQTGKLLAADADASAAEASSDARDSGVEADVFVAPDAATAAQIIEAVEYYFSDENLLKDAFLLKHVKRNKEGFVSLKLMSSFKRVKHVSRDWRVVAHAARDSSALEVNEEGSKVRRLLPLPEHDETITSRTVVAVNLPLENPTIASVSELFGKCGDISSIRVLKPGSAIPVDVRAAFNKHPDISWETVNCAVVEFDLQEQAKKAKETMVTATEDVDTTGMHIIPIGKVSNKKKSRQEEPRAVNASLEELNNAYNVKENAMSEKKRRQKRKKPLEHLDSNSSMSGTDGESWGGTPMRRLSSASSRPPLLPLPPGLRPHRLSPPSRPGGLFACTDIRLSMDRHLANSGKSQSSPNVLPPTLHAARTKARNSFCGVVPQNGEQCPWVVRRKASGLSDIDRRGSLMSQENVTREPRGPDGSRGFGQRPARSSASTVKVPAPGPNAVPIKAPAPGPRAVPITAPPPESAPVTSKASAAASVATKPCSVAAFINAPPFVPAAAKVAAAAAVKAATTAAVAAAKSCTGPVSAAKLTQDASPAVEKPPSSAAPTADKPASPSTPADDVMASAKKAPADFLSVTKAAPDAAPAKAEAIPDTAPAKAEAIPDTAPAKAEAIPATASAKAEAIPDTAPAKAEVAAPAAAPTEAKPADKVVADAKPGLSA